MVLFFIFIILYYRFVSHMLRVQLKKCMPKSLPGFIIILV